MNILQVIGVIAPSYGGPSGVALALSAELQDLGHSCQLLSTTYGLLGAEGVDETTRASLVAQGVQLFAPSHPKIFENSAPLYKQLRQVLDWADFVHIHGQYRLPPLVAWALARRAEVPFGIQPHGSLEPYDRKQSSARLKDAYHFAFGRRMYNQASYVMFASDSEAANAADLVPESKVLITPLGVRSVRPATPSDEYLVSRLASVDRRDVFLYLGRYAVKKQPTLLLEAWARSTAKLTGLLVLAGPDEGHTREALLSLAHDLGIADSTCIVGLLTAGEASWLYAKAGTFVLPSLNENFGISVAEAMLAGCFIVSTTDVASSVHASLAGDAEILGSSPNAASLARAIDYARSRVRLTGSVSNASYARKNLTWQPAAAALVARMSESFEDL